MDNRTEQALDKERRILEVVRRVISAVVRDTTPEPGYRHPLKSQTIEDIRQCFALISAREREIDIECGHESKDRPRYADESGSSGSSH